MRHLRALAIALVLSSLPVTLSILATQAATTQTVTRQVHRHAFSNAACLRATGRTGCYVIEATTQDVTRTNPLVKVFLPTVSAWSGCYGPITVSQSIYSSIGSRMATGMMRFQVCWDQRGIAVPFLQCWVNPSVLYGGWYNYCWSPAYPSRIQANPTWAEENWYFYPYPMPWWHINNIQQWGIYTTGVSPWYMCSYC